MRIWGPIDNGDYWKVKWITPEGVVRYKSLGPKSKVSKAAAKVAVIAFAARLQADSAADLRHDVTVDQLSQMRLKAVAGLSKATRTNEQITYDLLAAFFGGTAKARTIGKLRAAEWAEWLAKRDGKQGRKLSETTRRKHVGHAKRLFAWGVAAGLVPLNPFHHLKSAAPKTDKAVPYMTPATFAKLLEHTGIKAKQHPTLLCLCRWAGLRLSEALNLRWQDIDLYRRRINLPNPGTVHTTKKYARVIPIRPELAAHLEAAFSLAPTGSLGPCDKLAKSTSSNARNTKAAIKRAGIAWSGDPHHALRASCERDWINAGHPESDVCRWLGHDPRVARRHYLRDDDRQMAMAAGLQPSELDRTREELAAARVELERLKSVQIQVQTKLQRRKQT